MRASDSRTAAATAGRREGARRRDIHIGRHRPRAERGAEQRERGETRHEPGVGGHVEVAREHVAQRGELRVRVDDALGGTRGSGGEEDRRVVARLGRLGYGEVGAQRGDVGEACARRASAARRRSGRRTAEMRTPGQPRARAATRPGASPMTKSGHEPRTARVRPLTPRPASATTTTAPIRRHA